MSSSFVGLKLEPINEYNFIQWWPAQNLMIPLSEPIKYPTLSHANQVYYEYRDLPHYWQRRFRCSTYSPVFVHNEQYTFYINSKTLFTSNVLPPTNLSIGFIHTNGTDLAWSQPSALQYDNIDDGYRFLISNIYVPPSVKPGLYRMVIYNSLTTIIHYASTVIEVMREDECSYAALLEYSNADDHFFYNYRTGSRAGFVNKLRVHILEAGILPESEAEQYRAVNTGSFRNISSEPALRKELKTWFFDKNAHTAMSVAMDAATQGLFKINGKNYLPVGNYEANSSETHPLTKGTFTVQDQDYATARRGATYEAPPAFFLTSRRLSTPTISLDLDNKSIDEGEPVDTFVGNFLFTNTIGAVELELVPGFGADDNSKFYIASEDLFTKQAFNYDTQNIFSIRVKITDITGNSTENVFIISVNDVNTAITDVSLSNNTIEEDLPTSTLIGLFSTTGGTGPYSYQIVQGPEFNITAGNQLVSKQIFDYETRNNYTILVRSTDINGETYTKTFTILILDVDEETEYDLTLSENRISENQVPRAIGQLTGIGGKAPYTYSLYDSGSGEQIFFEIINGSFLASTITFNYEIQSSYQIGIQWEDDNAEVFQKVFTILILDLPEAGLENLQLTGQVIDENEPINTQIGIFTAVGGVAPYIYSLPAGAQNNSEFNILGGVLRSSISFDYESNTQRWIRAMVTDANNASLTRDFLILIGDVPEIDDIRLDKNHVCEDVEVGTLVGNLSTLGGIGPYTYSLVAGTGSADNASFEIVANTIITDTTFDYSTKDQYSVRVRTTDSESNTFEKVYIIYINEVAFFNVVQDNDIVSWDADTVRDHTRDKADINFFVDPDTTQARINALFKIDVTGYDPDDFIDAHFECRIDMSNNNSQATSFPGKVELIGSFEENNIAWENVYNSVAPVAQRFNVVQPINYIQDLLDESNSYNEFDITLLAKNQNSVISNHIHIMFSVDYLFFAQVYTSEHATALYRPRMRACVYNPDNPGPDPGGEDEGVFNEVFDEIFY